MHHKSLILHPDNLLMSMGQHCWKEGLNKSHISPPQEIQIELKIKFIERILNNLLTYNFNEPSVVHARQISFLESVKYLEKKTPRGLLFCN